MTNSMTIAEKLRFLADKAEDEKEFYIGDCLFKYQNEILMEPWDPTKTDSKFMKSHKPLASILTVDLKLKPQWEFTEDEKVILRNLPDDYQWIARDEPDNWICVYNEKPIKGNEYWGVCMGGMENLKAFTHLFQSIQWSDDEPCEFRKYI